MDKSLKSILSSFDGIKSVEFEGAAIDKDDGGVFPASITMQFTPDETGFHAMEFIVWALGDMSRAGANVRHHLRSPPPWLNRPGNALRLDIYLYPRSDDISDKKALAETAREVKEMAEFTSQVHQEYWSLCSPQKSSTA